MKGSVVDLTERIELRSAAEGFERELAVFVDGWLERAAAAGILPIELEVALWLCERDHSHAESIELRYTTKAEVERAGQSEGPARDLQTWRIVCHRPLPEPEDASDSDSDGA